jgi:hypothetical protein
MRRRRLGVSAAASVSARPMREPATVPSMKNGPSVNAMAALKLK